MPPVRLEPATPQSGVKHSTREPSGSVVECLTRDRGAVGSSLTASLHCGP